MGDFDRGVVVVGLGYIGLPTAAALATSGVSVTGVDVDASKVNAVNAAEVRSLEPDLAAAVERAVTDGLLRASLDVPAADAFVIAVPTPFLADKSADLTYVERALDSIAPVLTGGEVIILESTSPPGTTRQICRRLQELRPDLAFPGDPRRTPDVGVAYCPERVLPGRIMTELIDNARVIGGMTTDCSRDAAALYRIFCRGRLALTSAEAAEMSKLAENAFRDVNLAFANELSMICDDLGIDAWEVIDLANMHPRVSILQPGPGVGGHCIAVDPWFIYSAAPARANLIRTAREVNDSKPNHVAAVVADQLSHLAAPRIACLGLTFKANVDDTRQSPAIDVVHEVRRLLPEAQVALVDPHLDRLPDSLQDYGADWLDRVDEAVEWADAVVILVDHHAFRLLDRRELGKKILIDTRGLVRGLPHGDLDH